MTPSMQPPEETLLPDLRSRRRARLGHLRNTWLRLAHAIALNGRPEIPTLI
jgi:hypothetical protein